MSVFPQKAWTQMYFGEKIPSFPDIQSHISHWNSLKTVAKGSLSSPLVNLLQLKISQTTTPHGQNIDSLGNKMGLQKKKSIEIPTCL